MPPRTQASPKGRHLAYNNNDVLCITAVDPSTCKLLIPLQDTFETRAQQRNTLPSLCQLFLNNRCRQGANCYQVHARWEVVQALRAEVDSLPECCVLHGDSDRVGSQPHVVLHLPGVTHGTHPRLVKVTVTSRLASAGGEGAGANKSNNARNKQHKGISEEQQVKVCIPLECVSYTVALQRLLDGDKGGHSNSNSNSSSSDETAANSAPAADGAAGDEVMVVHGGWRVLDGTSYTVCRLHATDRCRYAEECKFLHVCKEITEANPELTAGHPAAGTGNNSMTNDSIAMDSGRKHSLNNNNSHRNNSISNNNSFSNSNTNGNNNKLRRSGPSKSVFTSPASLHRRNHNHATAADDQQQQQQQLVVSPPWTPMMYYPGSGRDAAQRGTPSSWMPQSPHSFSSMGMMNNSSSNHGHGHHPQHQQQQYQEGSARSARLGVSVGSNAIAIDPPLASPYEDPTAALRSPPFSGGGGGGHAMMRRHHSHTFNPPLHTPSQCVNNNSVSAFNLCSPCDSQPPLSATPPQSVPPQTPHSALPAYPVIDRQQQQQNGTASSQPAASSADTDDARERSATPQFSGATPHSRPHSAEASRAIRWAHDPYSPVGGKLMN